MDAPVIVSGALPERRRLHSAHEFKRVYGEGKRYDGHFLIAFVRRNELPDHRLGVTASAKAIGKAVQRNRAKRLLRELFRGSAPELQILKSGYDWVLNARQPLLAAGKELRFKEFRNIIAQVAKAEHPST